MASSVILDFLLQTESSTTAEEVSRIRLLSSIERVASPVKVAANRAFTLVTREKSSVVL